MILPPPRSTPTVPLFPYTTLVRSLRSQRGLTEKTVRSPINGVVTERARSVGEYRGPSSSHILAIAQLDPLNVEVFAPISQLGTVNEGDWVTIFPEEPVIGRAHV